jgi:hypothetical protein
MAIIPLNDLGSWTVGQLYPAWELALTRDTRTMDLTGVTAGQLSMIIYTAAKVVAGNSPGMGTFTINNAKPAVVVYTQSSGDMATAGTFYLKVKVNFNGSTPDYSDYIKLAINQ